MFLLASLMFPSPTPAPMSAPAPGMVPVRAEQVRLATSLNDQPVLTLSPAEDTARSLLRSVDMEAISGSGSWPPTELVSLEAAALDGVREGSWWTLFAEDGQTTCRVSGFAVEIWEAGDPDTVPLHFGAPCGSPLFVATLDCQGSISPEIAVPTESAGRVSIGRYAGEGEVVLHPAAERLYGATVEQAARLGAGDVHRSFRADRFVVGGLEVDVARGRYYTGEGDDGCGGDDLVRAWTGLVVAGRVVAPRETTGDVTRLLLDLEGDGRIESLSSSYTVRTLSREDGTTIRSDNVNYCECGC